MTNKTIALVGQPNAGKSTLFNVLSDIKTSTSNFAGTTVQFKKTSININGCSYDLIDLPGVYSLNTSDAAEDVTLDFILNKNVDLIINVVDTTLLARSLELTVELTELGLPMVVALNMHDEAERLGVYVDEKGLSDILNIPVIATTALFGKGVKKLVDICDDILSYKTVVPESLEFTYHLETSLGILSDKLNSHLDKDSHMARFYAIKSFENPKIIPDNLMDVIRETSKTLGLELQTQHKKENYESIAYERHHLAMKLTHEISKYKPRKEIPFTDKLDNYLLHPVLGYFFMVIFFFVYFFLIFIIGTGLSSLVDAPLQKIPGLYIGLKTINPLLWYTVDGIFQGISGGLGIVLPYFIPLLFLTSIFEDTGYLSRIAFLLDGAFHKVGLHGKSIAPFIMGFGCAVPALYATRIIEDKRDRLVTGILINFIPCSARISVIFALAAAFTGPFWPIVIFNYVLLMLAINGKLLSRFLSQPTGLILEIPNLKPPSISVTINKTRIKLMEFVKSAMPYLMIGSVVLAWIDYFKIGQYINILFSPIVKNVLNLPEQLGVTLIFGFLRKELIIVMANQAMGVKSLSQLPLSVSQVIVFLIFVTLYFPCVSTFAVFWKEFGKKAAVLSALLTFVIATLSAFLFRIMLNI